MSRRNSEMRERWLEGLAVVLVVIGGTGCGGRRESPRPAPPAAVPTVKKEVVVANVKEVAEKLAQVNAACNQWDLPAAIAAAEAARRLQPTHRKTLLVLSSLLLSRGRQAELNGDRDDASPYFFRAAQTMRVLRENFDDLDDLERRFLGEAIYSEAASFAVANDRARAIQSLTEALEAGFVDWKQFDTNSDFDDLRTSVELREIIAKYRTMR